MLCGKGDDEVVAAQVPRRETPAGGGVADDRHVDLAALERIAPLVGVDLVDHQTDARTGGTEAVEDCRQGIGDGRGDGADAQRARQPGRRVGGDVAGALRGRDEGATLIGEGDAGSGERDRAVRPFEKAGAEVALELEDRLAERRLRHVQAPGGTSVVQLVRHREVTGSLLARFATFDSSAVSDGLDRLGLHCGLAGIGPVWRGPALVGRAVTVQLEPAGAAGGGAHVCATAIAGAGPENVVVVANDGRIDVSAWGGLFSLGTRCAASAARSSTVCAAISARLARSAFRAGSVYVNFLDSDDDSSRVREAYGEKTYRRLAEVKAIYDPDNAFHHNKNIQPG